MTAVKGEIIDLQIYIPKCNKYVVFLALLIPFSWFPPAMHESSKHLYECLDDMYESDWYGRKDVDSLFEVIVLYLSRCQ